MDTDKIMERAFKAEYGTEEIFYQSLTEKIAHRIGITEDGTYIFYLGDQKAEYDPETMRFTANGRHGKNLQQLVRGKEIGALMYMQWLKLRDPILKPATPPANFAKESKALINKHIEVLMKHDFIPVVQAACAESGMDEKQTAEAVKALKNLHKTDPQKWAWLNRLDVVGEEEYGAIDYKLFATDFLKLLSDM